MVVGRSNRDQYALIIVGIVGSLVAGLQGMTALGHLVALSLVPDMMNDTLPDAQEIAPSASFYVRGAAHASVNLALAAVCVGAIVLAARSTRRGSTVLPWVCLGVVAVVALLTFSGWTWHGEAM